MTSYPVTLQRIRSSSSKVVLIVTTVVLALASGGLGFKYHDFCASPPMDMKTKFEIYKLEVDTKIDSQPWAYRQNNTITVNVKALYLQYKIRQVFLSVPSMTRGTPEVPAKRIHLGKWKWNMEGGVVPLDCSITSGFGYAADAVRNLWWYGDGLYNVTAEWDPLNTIMNAYNVDLVQFEAFVTPDKPVDPLPPGVYGPMPQQPRWVKLTSQMLINLDYIDLQRWIQAVYGRYNISPGFFGGGSSGQNNWAEMDG